MDMVTEFWLELSGALLDIYIYIYIYIPFLKHIKNALCLLYVCTYVCNFSFLKENTLRPNVQRIKRCLFRDSHKKQTHFMDQILAYLLLKPVGNCGNRCVLRC